MNDLNPVVDGSQIATWACSCVALVVVLVIAIVVAVCWWVMHS